jgi:hypothetical protein
MFKLSAFVNIKKAYSPHSWTILEGENPRILQKIRSPVFQCSRITSSRCWSDFGRISQQIRGFQIDYECYDYDYDYGLIE